MTAMIACIIIAMGIVLTSAQAAIHWISAGQSIQEAVHSAVDGDTILIQDGTYTESVILYGRLLTIGSEYLIDDDSTHIAQTVLIADPNRPDSNSCFVYSYEEPVGGRLVGLTLSSGSGTLWDAVNGPAGGNLFVSHFSSVSIEHCLFLEGQAGWGGGLAVCGPSRWTFDSFCAITNCSFQNCRAELYGGAICAYQCSLYVASTVFEADTCGASGGGLCELTAYVTVDSCQVRHCYGQGCGGMLVGHRGGYLQNTVFEHNGSGGAPDGTHLQVSMDVYPFFVSRCIFRENDGLQIPVWITGSGGQAPTYFFGNVIEDNTAMLRSGTLIFGSHAWGEVAYNVIRNNININGGAINCFQDAHPHIHHNVIDGNISTVPDWGAAFVSVTDGDPVLDSNLITNHAPPIFSFHPTSHVIIDARYNWWGDPSGPYHPTLNPNGQGDSLLTDSVLFIPWLTEPPDTTMPPDYLPVDEPPEVPRTWQVLECYPNPFNSSIRIILAGFAGQDFEITLHNLLGQVVDVIHRGPMTGGEIAYQAPSYLASGVYFIRATDRVAVQSRKVIFLK